MSEEKRVVFYSTHDMSAGWNLEKAEKFFDTIEINSDFSLIDYIEFYNIQQYFENGIFLIKWSDEEKEKYKKISEELFKKTILFIKGINDENILNYIDQIDSIYRYQEHFWQLIDKFKVYENISNDKFNEILNKYPYYIKFVLKHKNIVKKFDEDIKTFLINYENSWELLISHIKATDEDGKKTFPQSLTNQDKEDIIIKYIEKEAEWFGNLEFISRIWDDSFLKLSAKTKLKAKQMHEKKIKEFFANNNNTQKFWFQVGLSKNQKEPIKVETNADWLPSFSYSVAFLDSIDFEKNPLWIFIPLFGYINKKWLINLVSKDSEISAMELLFSHREKNDYKVSVTFKNQEMLSLLNMQVLNTYLKNFKNSCLEDIINNYIANILSKNSNLENLQFQINNYDIPYQEKITNLIPKFDSFIKQYRSYVEENKIDFELIDIDSRPILYQDIPSLLPDKYFYEIDNKLAKVKHYFYSDQSWLFYIEWFENKYNNFYDLIKKESLKLDNFIDYQQKIINELIEENYLYLDQNEYIKIKDELYMFLTWEIYREWVLSFYAYEWEIRNKIIEMKDEGVLLSESKLLSRQESDYMNYYLNKNKFTNWPEIRNKNIHWHKYTSEDEAYTDYLNLLKIIILILLKVDLEIQVKSS